MSNRAFGVEIECFNDEGDSSEWDGGDCVDMTADLLRDQGFSDWANLVTQDDSLYADSGGYGAEVKSPILIGDDGFAELTSVMNILRAHHYWVDDHCGMHVHLDAPEFVDNKRLIVKVVKAWKRNQHLINNMVAEERLDNTYCSQWYDDDISELENSLDAYGTSEQSLRGAINVSSLPYHGTIEIRQHEGTLNPEEAVSWVKFCQAFVDTVTGTTVQKISSEELLMRRLKVERNASRFLTTKARINKNAREVGNSLRTDR